MKDCFIFGIWEWLFDVVEKFFVEKGFNGVLMWMIIDEVNVNSVVMYYYFCFKVVFIRVVFECCFGFINEECECLMVVVVVENDLDLGMVFKVFIGLIFVLGNIEGEWYFKVLVV